MSRMRCSQQRQGKAGSVARGTWGYRVMGPASQLPILLITLEDIPKGFQGFWGKEVDATVDDVTDKGAGLLHIVQDLRGKRAGVRRGGAPATIPTDPLNLRVLPVATGVVLNSGAHLVTALQLHLQGKSKLRAFSQPSPPHSAPRTQPHAVACWRLSATLQCPSPTVHPEKFAFKNPADTVTPSPSPPWPAPALLSPAIRHPQWHFRHLQWLVFDCLSHQTEGS